MSERTLPPIDPQLEQLVASALHEHAWAVRATQDPAALSARLARHDKVLGLRRLGVLGALVVALVAGVLVLGASRRDGDVRTAGQATAVAPGHRGTAPDGTGPGVGGDRDDQQPGATTDGTTRDLSIPMPDDLGVDGSPSTTPTAPGGVTTSSTPGVTTTVRPGSPSPGPGGPAAPGPTTGPTTTPANPPASGPSPTTTPPTAPPTTPSTTIDPGRQCAAHQVSAQMRLTATTVGVTLHDDFDNGVAPPNSVLTVGSDDRVTNAYILSTTTRSDAAGHWAWSVQWDARRTPVNVPLSFFISCANGVKLPFTVTRVP